MSVRSVSIGGAERLWTKEQTAEYLSISLRHLWTITAKGLLPSIKIGRSVRYDRGDLEAYVKRCRSTEGKA